MREEELINWIAEAGKKSDFHYQSAVAWAILQGVYLAHAKETVVHGNFKAWIKEKIPGVSYETANRNRKLACAIRDELKNGARATFGPEQLLRLPYLHDSEREEVLGLIEKIEQLTDGRSLRQLYFDYEVCRRPDRKGGKTEPKEPESEPSEEEVQEQLEFHWNGFMGTVSDYLEEEDLSWTLLPKPSREALIGTLEPFVKKLKASLR